MMQIQLQSNSPDETIELGQRIGGQLRGGEVISLIGDLGTGKTHLVKGIAAGVGASEAQPVTSPTFVLVNEYNGKLDIFHIDAYRLQRESDFEMLGFYDFLSPGSVVIIEWADKVATVLAGLNCIEITIRHAGLDARTITISNAPDYITV
jgi:tRNA threonylcarbamoyladenosine biosynthesis protein TsaE